MFIFKFINETKELNKLFNDQLQILYFVKVDDFFVKTSKNSLLISYKISKQLLRSYIIQIIYLI